MTGRRLTASRSSRPGGLLAALRRKVGGPSRRPTWSHNDDGTLDEIFTDAKYVHIEAMSGATPARSVIRSSSSSNLARSRSAPKLTSGRWRRGVIGRMVKTTFTCDMCAGTYEMAWSDDEARAESKRVFGDVPEDDLAVICDNCLDLAGLGFMRITRGGDSEEDLQ